MLSSCAFTLKISRYTWRMSTSRRNRNKFTIIPTSATLKNTNVLTIHRRSDGGAVISFIATYMHCMRPQSLLDVIYITTTLIKPLSHWQRRIFLRKMASNQTNRFQSLDLSVEEFIDGQKMRTLRKRLNNMLLCSMNFLFWKARQVSQRVPYNGSQKRRQLGIRA